MSFKVKDINNNSFLWAVLYFYYDCALNISDSKNIN